MKIGEAVYKAQSETEAAAAAEGTSGPSNANPNGPAGPGGPGGKVVDAEFEDVDPTKKKQG